MFSGVPPNIAEKLLDMGVYKGLLHAHNTKCTSTAHMQQQRSSPKNQGKSSTFAQSQSSSKVKSIMSPSLQGGTAAAGGREIQVRSMIPPSCG